MTDLMNYSGNGNRDDGDMDFLDLQNIINNAMAKQNEKLYKMVAEIKNKQDKQVEKLSILEDENNNLREIELKRHRVTEHRFGFVGLSDLGQSWEVSIGSKTMGKLLRLAGLAKTKQSKTEPLRSATLNNYAKSMMYGDYPTYQWNPEKCIEKIDRWLEKEELIDTFYAIEDEKALMEYINKLFEDYGN